MAQTAVLMLLFLQLILSRRLSELLEPHEADTHHVFVEFLADLVRFFVQVIVDESHGLHGREYAVVKLAFVIANLRFFLHGNRTAARTAQGRAFMEGCGEHAHFCFTHLAIVFLHLFDEELGYEHLLLRCEDDFIHAVRHVELIE